MQAWISSTASSPSFARLACRAKRRAFRKDQKPPTVPTAVGNDQSGSAKLREHRFRARHFVFPRRFDVERLDDAVIDQRRKTLTARAHPATFEIEFEPERLGVA